MRKYLVKKRVMGFKDATPIQLGKEIQSCDGVVSQTAFLIGTGYHWNLATAGRWEQFGVHPVSRNNPVELLHAASAFHFVTSGIDA